MNVKPHHPLAEQLAKVLLGIETLPLKEQTKICDEVVRKAVLYVEKVEKERDAWIRSMQAAERKSDTRGEVLGHLFTGCNNRQDHVSAGLIAKALNYPNHNIVGGDAEYQTRLEKVEAERDGWKDAEVQCAEEVDRLNSALRIIVADHKRMEAENKRLRDVLKELGEKAVGMYGCSLNQSEASHWASVNCMVKQALSPEPEVKL